MLFVMVTMKIVLHVIEEQYTSTALGIAAMVKSVGSIIFQGFSGLLVDAKGFSGLYGFATILTAVGLLFCVMLRQERQAERAIFSGRQSSSGQ